MKIEKISRINSTFDARNYNSNETLTFSVDVNYLDIHLLYIQWMNDFFLSLCKNRNPKVHFHYSVWLKIDIACLRIVGKQYLMIYGNIVMDSTLWTMNIEMQHTYASTGEIHKIEMNCIKWHARFTFEYKRCFEIYGDFTVSLRIQHCADGKIEINQTLFKAFLTFLANDLFIIRHTTFNIVQYEICNEIAVECFNSYILRELLGWRKAIILLFVLIKTPSVYKTNCIYSDTMSIVCLIGLRV